MNPSTYEWNFGILWQYRELFLSALGTTVYLALATIAAGVLFGAALVALRRTGFAPLVWLTTAFVELVRALPPLVLLVWIYYCMPILLGIQTSGFWTTVLALAVYSAAFYAEIFRAGLQSVEHGLNEAGLAVGMSRWQILRRIAGPLAFQRVFPPFISQCVLVVKNTSLAGYIAVNDILYVGQRVSNATFRPIEVLTVVAAVFIVVIVPLSAAAGLMEKRLRAKYAR
ncbi:amino acid ABC transporter permease [Bordetella genomosp. 10]|uniref:Amino acid ABC transporter permease n=1 Tax=Bordetella genomosp. 10 TaxID=1416804 RepID=A0A261SLF7_9BORD|nr:amino acid ABC transporter permease [Bordetella genomosp. 10]OZI38269.1 amino acid ABC transporter permease [Bordetella genomosp. 10]